MSASLFAAALLIAATVVPDAALAHGLVGRQDLPIPRWLFAWGAAVVLVVSFVALAVLWPKPRLEGPGSRADRRLVGLPVALEIVAGLVGIAIFAVTVWAGLAGTQTEAANLAPTVVYVLFWIGVPVLSVFLGDVFRPFNPWRATARGVAWVVGRAGSGSRAAADPVAGGEEATAPRALTEAIPYPTWLGRWPAAVGILAFAWLELVSSSGGDPSVVAIFVLVYFAVQLIGMSLFGIDAWSRNGDAFGVYFGLFASLAPLESRDGALFRRRFLSGTTRITAVPGTVALLCVMIGSTSFDGFSGGPTWSDIAPDIAAFFTDDLGFSAVRGLEATFTIGMLAMCLLVAALYRLGIAGMRTIGDGADATQLGRRFAHTLVPIALAYVIAHYFSLLVYQGQAVAYLASDPLGDGSDLLGTADATIDYGVIDANGIWYVQVAALVIGHAAGLVLAHERALVIYRKARDATRSQYWMLAVMVGFTSLGLWLLSAGAQ